MRGAPFVLFVVAAAVAGVVFQHGVGDVPVRYQLNRAVVVAQLFLGQKVRTVAVDLPVDVIESNVASAFEVVVQTARALDGSRFVSDVAELVYDGGKRCCRVRPLFMRGLAERVGRWVALPAWIDEVADIGVAEREEVERWKRTSCLAA